MLPSTRSATSSETHVAGCQSAVRLDPYGQPPCRSYFVKSADEENTLEQASSPLQATSPLHHLRSGIADGYRVGYPDTSAVQASDPPTPMSPCLCYSLDHARVQLQ
ncbi:uncharacterized protein UMAG_12092 [Mycosarcoma maydis]|uniref:Uncharacterized protein n=1 Tax=Mycosarcoma maydis TaxID=5270 RepID=A0A0D1CHD7_MYCMD|nr:uncharacterized protein UMAG_12092 [Ustilago maydis 521]KIS66388.1 hypothetical protein UMAG_12092 [Ustilago maydis 521]|eukprot:XP_011392165.1 hypothetical protein UMAG_12092 [Ustilago maydis 521]